MPVKNKKILGLNFILICLLFFGRPAYGQEEKVSVSVRVGDTALSISGWSFPGAYITITENEAVIGTVMADGGGYFEKELFAQEDGKREIGFYATDEEGETTFEATYEVKSESKNP